MNFTYSSAHSHGSHSVPGFEMDHEYTDMMQKCGTLAPHREQCCFPIFPFNALHEGYGEFLVGSSKSFWILIFTFSCIGNTTKVAHRYTHRKAIQKVKNTGTFLSTSAIKAQSGQQQIILSLSAIWSIQSITQSYPKVSHAWWAKGSISLHLHGH